MLWAVHIPDSVLSPLYLGIGLGILVILLAIGCYRFDEEQIAKTGVFTAILFVASLIHPPIPGTKVHLLLNGMAGILLGAQVGLAVPIALLLQALLLSHGGVYTVGVNSATIGVPALLTGALYWVARRYVGLDARWKRYLIGGTLAAVGVLSTLVLYYLVLRFGSIQEEDLQLLASIAFVWHIPVLIIEVIFTALLVDFLYRIKPELLGIHTSPKR